MANVVAAKTERVKSKLLILMYVRGLFIINNLAGLVAYIGAPL